MSGSGVYEIHVTVAPTEQIEQFKSSVIAWGAKPVLIELPQGSLVPLQPMTAHYVRGTEAEAREQATALASCLEGAGFEVTRVKIEANYKNAGVPTTDEEASKFPENYFEFHVKVLTENEAHETRQQVSEVSQRYNAHFSRNAFSKTGGTEERFLTSRLYGCGLARAMVHWESLCEALKGVPGVQLSNRLYEYTVYDSKVALNAGWIVGSSRMGPSYLHRTRKT